MGRHLRHHIRDGDLQQGHEGYTIQKVRRPLLRSLPAERFYLVTRRPLAIWYRPIVHNRMLGVANHITVCN